jgi:signal peptidase II
MTLVVIATLLFLDQLTKFAATRLLTLNNPFCLIKGVFCLTLIHNRGAAFGILQNQRLFFIAASLLAVVFIYLALKKNQRCFSTKIFFCLIIAGALGNLIDRVLWGYVIDFLDFRIWPVFNLADSAITIGTVSLGWQVLSKKKQ